MMEAMKINKSQLELSLKTAEMDVPCVSRNRRVSRLRRASLWFQRMRQVVDQAVDHLPAAEPGWFKSGR